MVYSLLIQEGFNLTYVSVFTANKLYEELERILKINKIEISIGRVLAITETITTIKIKLPKSGETIGKTMVITPKHREIALLFDENT